jgi:hypothetical protein
MSTEITKTNYLESIEKALLKGDLASLSEKDRITYYNTVCESVGLNPLTQPFSMITLNNKLTLYANKTCTDQLRSIHKISVHITAREKIDEVYVVTASARNTEGRVDESTGAVYLGKTTGEALANLFLKAETKAKRRVTLSICGLGLLDESEVESIPPAKKTITGIIPEGKMNLIEELVNQLGMDIDHPKTLLRFKEITGKESWDLWTPEDIEKIINILESKIKPELKEVNRAK